MFNIEGIYINVRITEDPNAEKDECEELLGKHGECAVVREPEQL